MFDDQRNLLLTALEAAHSAYYQAETFGGPSLHFHLKSLDAARAQDFERFAEYVYAVLASWGMHRMGPGRVENARVRRFSRFVASRLAVSPATPGEDTR
jgi:hypothetical protein